MRLTTILPLTLLLAIAAPATADVIIPGGVLTEDTVWTAAEGPYYVNGDVTIARGVTLTIEAGTLVRFSSRDSQAGGSDTTLAELIVRGSLLVNGTPTAPVELGAPPHLLGTWNGIIVESTATRLVLREVTLYQTRRGIEHRATAASVDTHAVVLPSLKVTAGAPRYQGLTVNAASYGVEVADAGGLTLVNSVVLGGSQAGIYFSPTATGRSLVVTNCSLRSRGGAAGIYLRGGATSTAAITNTIVVGATTGIVAADATAVTTSHNDVWGNTTNYQGVVPDARSISASPQYQSLVDLHLADASPCVDAGTAAGAPSFDRDGKRRPIGAQVDIGAYEVGMATLCGDGNLDPGEACDDGAANGAYGQCNATCTGPGPRCGDGSLDGPEACDDGNLIAGDGCDARCQLEVVDAGVDAEVTDAGADAEVTDAGVDAEVTDAGVDAEVTDASVDADVIDAIATVDAPADGAAAADAGTTGGAPDGGCCSTGGGDPVTTTGAALALAALLARRRRR